MGKMTTRAPRTKPVQEESWNQKHWRSAMGWVYMAICLFDFIIGPILFQYLEFHTAGQDITAYKPLTLQGSGLIHISFGAILGITTYGRTREKLKK